MKEINLEELKILQLEMLKQVDDFCKINNIKYFLSAGSLIGAVRHQGYIPWDDDIDIMMLRPDYDKFVKSFNGFCKNLNVVAPELDWNYYAPYANVYDNRTLLIERNVGHRKVQLGVKIDIFPFDALPESEFRYSFERKIVLLLNSALYSKNTTLKFRELKKDKKISKILFYFIPYTFIQKIISFIAKSAPYNKAKSVFLRTFDINKPMRATKEIFADVIYVPFEQYLFPIPKMADEYLKIRYGDYLKLPPEEERVPHHNFMAYWK